MANSVSVNHKDGELQPKMEGLTKIVDGGGVLSIFKVKIIVKAITQGQGHLKITSRTCMGQGQSGETIYYKIGLKFCANRPV